MLKEERHQKILNEVSLRNRVLLNDIADHLDVSVDTVRRDVKELDKKQLLKKVQRMVLLSSVLPTLIKRAFPLGRKLKQSACSNGSRLVSSRCAAIARTIVSRLSKLSP